MKPSQVSALRGGNPTGTRPLRHHAFASPERLAEIVDKVNDTLDASLPDIVQRMRRYLPQQGTFHTLYKPIKANILDAHAQVDAIVESEYSDTDVQRIKLRSKDELISLLDKL